MEGARMVTLDEGIAIAREVMPMANEWADRGESFEFFNNDLPESDGGLGILVVVKESGEAIDFVTAITEGLVGDELDRGKF